MLFSLMCWRHLILFTGELSSLLMSWRQYLLICWHPDWRVIHVSVRLLVMDDHKNILAAQVVWRRRSVISFHIRSQSHVGSWIVAVPSSLRVFDTPACRGLELWVEKIQPQTNACVQQSEQWTQLCFWSTALWWQPRRTDFNDLL